VTKGLPDFTLPVSIRAQEIASLAVDIVAQTLANLKVDINAQTLSELKIRIVGSDVTLDVNVTNAQLNVNITGSSVTLNVSITSPLSSEGYLQTSIEKSIQLDVNIAASSVTLDVNIAASAVTLNVSITSPLSTEGYLQTSIEKSIQLDVNIAASSVTLDVNIAASSVTLNVSISSPLSSEGYLQTSIEKSIQLDVNIAASSVTLDVNIAASSVTLNVSISSPLSSEGYLQTSIEKSIQLDVNIAAQAVTLDVNIAASAVTLDVNIASQAVTLNVNIESSTPLTAAPPKSALALDGDNDYVRLPVISVNEFTVEALLFYRDGEPSGDYGGIVANLNGATNTNRVLIRRDKVLVQLKIGGTTYNHALARTPGYYVNKRVHIVATYDGSYVRIYEDGVKAYEGAQTGTLDSGTTDTFVGWGSTDPDYYHLKGVLMYVRIYSRALSDDEVEHNYNNPNMPVTDGLIVWLNFDEGAGTIAYDKSGNGNDGTIYGARWVSETGELPATLNINIVASQITLDVNIKSQEVTLNVNIASSAVTLDVNIASSAVTLDINIAAQEVNVKIVTPSGIPAYTGNAKTGVTLWRNLYVDASTTVTAVSITGRGRVEAIALKFDGSDEGVNTWFGSARITIKVDGSTIIDRALPYEIDILNGLIGEEKRLGTSIVDTGARNPKGGAVWLTSDQYRCAIFMAFPIEFTSSFELIIENTHTANGFYVSGVVAYGVYP